MIKDSVATRYRKHDIDTLYLRQTRQLFPLFGLAPRPLSRQANNDCFGSAIFMLGEEERQALITMEGKWPYSRLDLATAQWGVWRPSGLSIKKNKKPEL